MDVPLGLGITLQIVAVRFGSLSIEKKGVGSQRKSQLYSTGRFAGRDRSLAKKGAQVKIPDSRNRCHLAIFFNHSFEEIVAVVALIVTVVQLVSQQMYLVHAQELGIITHLGHFGRGLGVLAGSCGNTHDKLRFHRILHRIIRGVVGHLGLALASRQGHQGKRTQNYKSRLHTFYGFICY